MNAGDPTSNWVDELWPNGNRINMGFYGGSSQASMSQSTQGNIADLNNDNIVNYIDFKMFADCWLNEKKLLKENINRDSIVYFSNYIIIAIIGIGIRISNEIKKIVV